MKTMYKITFGVEFDKNKNKIDFDAIKPLYTRLLIVAADLFGGLTETSHTGHYLHENGEHVVEESISIEIVTDSTEFRKQNIKSLVLDLKDIFNQESVMLTKTEVEADFV